MPDITFKCEPCKVLFSRYIREGETIAGVCKFCRQTIEGGLHTFNNGQVDFISGAFASRPTPAPDANHLRLPGDQYDYLSPIDGAHISSKRAHRDHLKRHGVIELGNERPALKPFAPKIPKESIRQEMRNQLERMKSDGQWRER